MANKLTQLRVDEVSAVDKAANGKKFLILKRAEPDAVEKRIVKEGDRWCVYSEDGTKRLGGPYEAQQEAADRLAEIEAFKHTRVAKTTFLGSVAASLRKAAGNSGPTTEVDDMTAEEIKKAIAEGAAEALAPFEERIKKLEEAAVPAGDDDGDIEGATGPVAKADDEPAAKDGSPARTEEQITKMIQDGVGEALKPLTDRIEKLENVEGERQSALDEEGAHKVTKSAQGFWEGSGLLF
ncbi:MAG: hypothetical protein JXA87_07900 [Thermoleophilia bacterium]|nr:hypothetical protein [Thermoleophilia bacterium]